MVKFKSRYVFCEVVGENSELSREGVVKELKKKIGEQFGSATLGKLTRTLQVKYVGLNTLIIRVNAEFLDQLWTVLALTTTLNGSHSRVKVHKISGSIKKCETAAQKLLKNWLVKAEKQDKM